jgi:cytochrome b561
MAVRAECSPHSLRDTCSREGGALALYACGAIIVAVVGVLGLVKVSWPRQMVEAWINIHALFGLLLFGLVIARYQWDVKHSLRPPLADIRELSRHLSRVVYLILYVVVGVRQVIGIVNSIWHGGTVDLTVFDERFRSAHDGRVFDPHNDYDMFLASGVITLAMVRLFLFKIRSELGNLSPIATTSNRQAG